MDGKNKIMSERGREQLDERDRDIVLHDFHCMCY